MIWTVWGLRLLVIEAVLDLRIDFVGELINQGSMLHSSANSAKFQVSSNSYPNHHSPKATNSPKYPKLSPEPLPLSLPKIKNEHPGPAHSRCAVRDFRPLGRLTMKERGTLNPKPSIPLGFCKGLWFIFRIVML